MARSLRLLVPASLSALLAGTIIMACSHHSSPGDTPAAPQPTPVAPSGWPAPSADPVAADGLDDGGVSPLQPGPSQPSPSQPSPSLPGTTASPMAGDAGVPDGYTPPPVPDSGIPGDSGIAPSPGRDGGR